MNGGADGNASDNARLDLADDFPDVAPAGLEAIDPGQALTLELRRRAGQDALYTGFQVALHLPLADPPAGAAGPRPAQPAIRKAKVPPSGTPADRTPMNSSTAEHE